MQQQREIEGTVVEQQVPELLVLKGGRRPPQNRIITCPDQHKLKAIVRREEQRKAIVRRSEIVEVRPNLWAVHVTQLRPIRPAWVRPALVTGGVVGGLGGLAGAGWALVSLVVGAAASLPVATAVGALAVLVLAWRLLSGGSPRGSSSGGGSEVSVDVSVRVRS